MKIGVIYTYTSPSGKKYVGQTCREQKRKSEHKCRSIKTNTYFGKALRKHGYENFIYEVLIRFNQTENIEKLKRVLDKLEERYIKLYKSDIPEFGYNLTKGGEGVLGFKHTDETKEYIKECSIKRMESIETREYLSKIAKERIFSEETKQKISDSRKNKKQVYQYDLENNLINTYNSISEASKTIVTQATLKTINNRISEACNGKAKSSYGYIWSFELQ